LYIEIQIIIRTRSIKPLNSIMNKTATRFRFRGLKEKAVIANRADREGTAARAKRIEFDFPFKPGFVSINPTDYQMINGAIWQFNRFEMNQWNSRQSLASGIGQILEVKVGRPNYAPSGGLSNCCGACDRDGRTVAECQ
jgi:hypothetical protein